MNVRVDSPRAVLKEKSIGKAGVLSMPELGTGGPYWLVRVS